ncbi:phosphotransferase [Enterovibrio norvegicus]|uniref:phosphotransferase n=1 Tax=Enterovibrio norvegicus TaxID=188144 RepID=UPI003550FD33
MHSNAIDEKAAVIDTLRPYCIITSAEYLVGGLSNRCMVLQDAEGHRYVWRPQGEGARVFGANREHEFNALVLGYDAGLTSKPVCVIPEGLLTAWIDGDVLDSADVETVMPLLARIHEMTPPTNTFDPFEKAQHYFAHLIDSAKTDRVTKVHAHFQRHAFKSGLALTMCHYDLGYYNLIKTSNGQLSVIDWEYAALGDPALDIVMTAFANDIKLSTAVNHYCAHRRIDDVAHWMNVCEKWEPVAKYLGLLWFLLGYELYGLTLYKERAETCLHELETLTLG